MKVSVCILGGGLAGLACARELHHLGVDYLLLERETSFGGLCRTIERKGFRFDYTGHFLHFHDPKTQTYVQALPGLRLKKRRRHAVIYNFGVYTEYPYQENTFGLPAHVKQENLLGLLEAMWRNRCGEKALDPGALSFEDWAIDTFGRGIWKNFLEPYNRKLWKFPLNRLTTFWMKRFVPSARLSAVLEGAVRRKPSTAGYNAFFWYPENSGISALPEALARGLPRLAAGEEVIEVDLKRKTVVCAGGLRVRYRSLVSTLPLKNLVLQSRGLPADLQRAARALKATSIYCVNLGVRRPQPHPYSWVYFPEAHFPFHRAGSISACVSEAAPPGASSFYVEFSYRSSKPQAAWIGKETVRYLKRLGWVRLEKEIAVRVDLDLPEAYVIYDAHREKIVPVLLRVLQKHGVHCAGRFGLWEYGSMESAIQQGRNAARRLVSTSRVL